jgi:hypothetical protein
VVLKGSDVDPIPEKGKICYLESSHQIIFLLISLHDVISKSFRFKQVFIHE